MSEQAKDKPVVIGLNEVRNGVFQSGYKVVCKGEVFDMKVDEKKALRESVTDEEWEQIRLDHTFEFEFDLTDVALQDFQNDAIASLKIKRVADLRKLGEKGLKIADKKIQVKVSELYDRKPKAKDPLQEAMKAIAKITDPDALASIQALLKARS